MSRLPADLDRDKRFREAMERVLDRHAHTLERLKDTPEVCEICGGTKPCTSGAV